VVGISIYSYPFASVLLDELLDGIIGCSVLESLFSYFKE
jgi:hypothetical protein